MSTWQPIETAPKDGTWVLAWIPELPSYFKPGSAPGWVTTCYNDEEWGDGRWITIEDDFVSPTHWMPLPEPPEVA